MTFPAANIVCTPGSILAANTAQNAVGTRQPGSGWIKVQNEDITGPLRVGGTNTDATHGQLVAANDESEWIPITGTLLVWGLTAGMIYQVSELV